MAHQTLRATATASHETMVVEKNVENFGQWMCSKCCENDQGTWDVITAPTHALRTLALDHPLQHDILEDFRPLFQTRGALEHAPFHQSPELLVITPHAKRDNQWAVHFVGSNPNFCTHPGVPTATTIYGFGL